MSRTKHRVGALLFAALLAGCSSASAQTVRRTNVPLVVREGSPTAVPTATTNPLSQIYDVAIQTYPNGYICISADSILVTGSIYARDGRPAAGVDLSFVYSYPTFTGYYDTVRATLATHPDGTAAVRFPVQSVVTASVSGGDDLRFLNYATVAGRTWESVSVSVFVEPC